MGATQIWGKTKIACKENTSPLIPKEEKICIHKIVGKFIYYATAVDPTILVALGPIAVNQAKSYETTDQAIKQLLYYCDTLPYATLRYKKSDMVIRVHSDLLYRPVYQVRIISGGNLFWGSEI